MCRFIEEYLLSKAAPLTEALVLAARGKMRSVGAEIRIFQGEFIFFIKKTLVDRFSSLRHDGDIPYYHPPTVREFSRSIGVLVPSWELHLVDDDEVDAKEGDRGEIWVRGPGLMKVRCHLISHFCSMSKAFSLIRVISITKKLLTIASLMTGGSRLVTSLCEILMVITSLWIGKRNRPSTRCNIIY
jgi:hypothetical protein